MFERFEKTLEELKDKGLFRSIRYCEPVSPVRFRVEGRVFLNFGSNNYLGLTHHPEVIKASVEAVKIFGTGGGASRLITGSHILYEKLEKELAEFKGFPSCLVFSSGYTANIGIISALCSRKSAIFCDKLAHASIIDGALLSRAKFFRFFHNDTNHLEELLKKHKDYEFKLIITEGVFSMDGDIPPLPEILKLAEEYDALMLLDDAHATGVIGDSGRGTLEFFKLRSSRIICMGTLSKALASLGGFVCAEKIIIDYLVNKGRSLIFSTALPPSAVAVGIKALEIIKKEPERVKRLQKNIKYLRRRLSDKGIKTHEFPTAIFPIIIGDTRKTLEVSEYLAKKGIFAPAIRPPTVPEGTARLRISLSAMHSEEDLDLLADTLEEALSKIS